jgi:hypothetical protein
VILALFFLALLAAFFREHLALSPRPGAERLAAGTSSGASSRPGRGSRASSRRGRGDDVALEGTLHDFALADILQLIALQKKTGLLTLRGPADTVILGIRRRAARLGGVAGAADRHALGTLLVKTRSLSPESLAKALEIQGQTLQRLGFILLKNGFCDADQLQAGLDAQVRKIAYGSSAGPTATTSSIRRRRSTTTGSTSTRSRSRAS